MNYALQVPLRPDGPPFALLVDRDRDTRSMYAEYLRLSRFRIEEAEDGREALAKALAVGPDIVVTETRLPGMSGFDLCAELRADAATATTPIVFVTGDGFATDLSHARDVGATSILVKPCLPETLFREVSRLLRVSNELRLKAANLREVVRSQIDRSNAVVQRSHEIRRKTLSRAHLRHDTSEPPVPPPALVCPACDRPLIYVRSHIGGVSARHPEQWDYFDCPAECGTFQYRQRTRKLRKVT